MIRRICTSTLRESHSYTRSRLPWLLDTCEDDKGEYKNEKQFGKKLFHYISGGGMRSFGRTVQQEVKDRKRTRFLIGSAIVGILWLLFLIF